MVPLSTFVQYDTQHVTFLSINHQGQFPAVTLSFNLAPGAALGDAVDAISARQRRSACRATVTGSFQGTAQAFQDSLKTEPYLILAALVVVYIILGMLYESYIHPLTILSTLPSAGVGALLMLMVFHFDLSVIALIGIILLDRHRQEERHHDGRLRDPGRARAAPAARGGDPPGLSAALPPDHDDHHGGAARRAAAGARPRHRLGAAPAARLTMVGGLILSQALTLFTTPVIYLYLDRFTPERRRARRLARKSVASAGPLESEHGRLVPEAP